MKTLLKVDGKTGNKFGNIIMNKLLRDELFAIEGYNFCNDVAKIVGFGKGVGIINKTRKIDDWIIKRWKCSTELIDTFTESRGIKKNVFK